MNMTNDTDQLDMTTDAALETLLRQASPRPVPNADDEAAVRRAVHAEWQGVVRRTRRRTWTVRFGLAATVVLAAFLAVDALRDGQDMPVEVASIDRSFGSIYLLGDRSELRETKELVSIVAGQTVVTGRHSGVGFVLNSGVSLRVDANARIEFLEEDVVQLHSGRVYVDSQSGALLIRTEHGDVTPLGTQYITRVDDRQLSVAVREGKVTITGRFHDAIASTGQQVSLRGSQRPSIANVARHGELWAWAEATAPSADFDGKSVKEFLEWVSRETGLALRFSSTDAEELANERTLNGRIDTAPMNALRVWMMGVDLEWRVDGGAIIISEKEH